MQKIINYLWHRANIFILILVFGFTKSFNGISNPQVIRMDTFAGKSISYFLYWLGWAIALLILAKTIKWLIFTAKLFSNK